MRLDLDARIQCLKFSWIFNTVQFFLFSFSSLFRLLIAPFSICDNCTHVSCRYLEVLYNKQKALWHRLLSLGTIQLPSPQV
jgi:hypothetical protein